MDVNNLDKKFEKNETELENEVPSQILDQLVEYFIVEDK